MEFCTAPILGGCSISGQIYNKSWFLNSYHHNLKITGICVVSLCLLMMISVSLSGVYSVNRMNTNQSPPYWLVSVRAHWTLWLLCWRAQCCLAVCAAIIDCQDPTIPVVVAASAIPPLTGTQVECFQLNVQYQIEVLFNFMMEEGIPGEAHSVAGPILVRVVSMGWMNSII